MTTKIRVLVVDDSAVNRRAITKALSVSPVIQVVGSAAHGEEALKFVELLKPDALTLDLEMPRMGGFAFLRILMARKPLPVIVVSTYAQRENVFRALELGALDFVAKPEVPLTEAGSGFRDQLIDKLHGLREMGNTPAMIRTPARSPAAEQREPHSSPPAVLLGIAASTGGPAALMEILRAAAPRPDLALLISQHMPERFTRTFAQRLDQQSAFRVVEAQHGEPVSGQTAYICPGGRCMEVERGAAGYKIALSPPGPDDRYVPSGDRLFQSLARVGGARAVGAILTGMGDDGSTGARAIRQAGGTVIAESEATAVVCGMPGAAERAGLVSQKLPLFAIAEWLGSVGC